MYAIMLSVYRSLSNQKCKQTNLSIIFLACYKFYAVSKKSLFKINHNYPPLLCKPPFCDYMHRF